MQSAIAWAAGFAIISVALGYGILHPDERVARLAFFANLAWHPAAAVAAYYETRSEWSGEDYELQQMMIIAGIIISVVALSFAI